MFLNSENTKIIQFLKSNSLINLADAYYNFLSAGKKINKNELKLISKLVRNMQIVDLEKKLLEILLEFGIVPAVQKEKSTLLVPSNLRVKKYRESLKAKGYKSLSFQVSADNYKKLRDLKLKNKMTYAELIVFLIDKK